MILSAIPIGEYDRRVVILTKEYGKISAFAKGARRPNSTLVACSQPFVFGTFFVYEGRDSYTMVGAEISNYFAELRNSLECIYYASYFCEFADYVTREGMEGTGILRLLYQSFRALIKQIIPSSLIKRVFELKLLAINGEAPQVFECVKCHRQTEEHTFHFHFQSRGMICEDCKKEKKGTFIMLSATAIYTMQYIITISIDKLYSFVLSKEVWEEFDYCMENYLHLYIEHEFKSIALIHML